MYNFYENVVFLLHLNNSDHLVASSILFSIFANSAIVFIVCVTLKTS